MSPEVLVHKAPANPSMDIWALGIILYKMIYGIYPFEADSRKEIFEKIKKGAFDFPEEPAISLTCQVLIKKMLTVDPLARISTVDLSNDIWITSDLE